MFKIEKTFIINDSEGKLWIDGTTNYHSVDKGTPGAVQSKYALKADDEKVLYIDNLINFRAEDIDFASFTAANPQQNEELVLDMPTFTPAKNEVYRLVIGLGQKGRVLATFNDMYPDHTKFLYHEGRGEDMQSLAANLQKSIDHDASMTDDHYVDIKVTNTNITIEALDEYTIVKSVRLVKVGLSLQNNVGAVLTGYEDYEVIGQYNREDQMHVPAIAPEGFTNVTFKEANAGVGTTNYLLQNVALQSDANINPYGLRVNDRPLPKSLYDQYHIEMKTDRRYIGSQVVGALNQSLTEYTFFVRTNGAGDTTDPSFVFKTVLNKLLAKANGIAQLILTSPVQVPVAPAPTVEPVEEEIKD